MIGAGLKPAHGRVRDAPLQAEPARLTDYCGPRRLLEGNRRPENEPLLLQLQLEVVDHFLAVIESAEGSCSAPDAFVLRCQLVVYVRVETVEVVTAFFPA